MSFNLLLQPVTRKPSSIGKLLASAILLFAFLPNANAQHRLCNPDTERFFKPLFDSVTVVTDQVYGRAPLFSGDTIDLLYDVYQPFQDTANLRPLIIVVHGGGFINGSKTDRSIQPFLSELTTRGYVVASINYRLDSQENIAGGLFRPGGADNQVTRAFIRAAQDAKAAIRYFYRSVAEMGNPYNIDTNAIILAGGSAGGITALHAVYVKDAAKWEGYSGYTLPGTLQELGGVAGNSGNAGFSENVMAVINIAGAIGDINWIDRFDIPVISLHGSNDLIVPYGSGGYQLGFVNIPLQGSAVVHDHLLANNGDSRLNTWPGAGHVPWATGDDNGDAYLDTALVFSIAHTYSVVCNVEAPYAYATDRAIVQQSAPQDLFLYPNPARQSVTLQLPENWKMAQATLQLRLLNAGGQVLQAAELQTRGSVAQLDVSGLSPGVYMLGVIHAGIQYNLRFIVA